MFELAVLLAVLALPWILVVIVWAWAGKQLVGLLKAVFN